MDIDRQRVEAFAAALRTARAATLPRVKLDALGRALGKTGSTPKPAERLVSSKDVPAAYDVISGESKHKRLLQNFIGNTSLPAITTVRFKRESDTTAVTASLPGSKPVGCLDRTLARIVVPLMDRERITQFKVLGVICGLPHYYEVDICVDNLITRGPSIPVTETLERRSTPGQDPATTEQIDLIQIIVSQWDRRTTSGRRIWEEDAPIFMETCTITGTENYRDSSNFEALNMSEAAEMILQLNRLRDRTG